MHLTMGAASHVGKVRSVNEDSCLAMGSLAAVADGMGGHACGDVASRIAKDALAALSNRSQLGAEEIRAAILGANASIVEAGRADPAKAGMGTTVTGIALIEHFGNPHWMVFNVGDSRVYRITAAGCEQITRDHSEVAELVAAGRITKEEAATHPLRNVVTRSLGTDPAPDVDTWLFPPHIGDLFVICSDGLTNEVSETDIARIAVEAATPGDAAAHLVSAALDHGARDNVTTVVVRVDGAPDEENDTIVSTRPRKTLEEDS